MALQETYFNLISATVNKDNWRETLFPKLIAELCSFLDAEYIATYLYYQRTASYQLINEVGNLKTIQFYKDLIGYEDVSVEDFYEKRDHSKSDKLLSIRITEDETLYLVIVTEAPLYEEVIEIITENLNKAFSILAVMMNNQNQSHNNKFLLDLSTKLLKSNDKNVILEEIVAALKMRYGQYEFNLHLTQEHKTQLDLPLQIMQYTDENINEVITRVFMTGELEMESRINERSKYIFAPLIGEQSVYGVLELITPIDKYFGYQEVGFITDFAELAGKALEKTILYEDSLLQITNLTLLNEIIHELNTTSELPEITTHISKKISTITNASQVGFIYYGEESTEDFRVLTGSTSLFDGETGRNLVQTIKDEMDKNHEPIFSGSYAKEGLGYHSIMVIPMLYSGLSMGFAVILHEEKYHFTFEAFKLIQSLIQHTSVVISNTMLKERLQTTVITDYLTQLYSRRYLEDAVNDHMYKGQSGCLLIIDIDDFKLVNDKYGHHIGDKVLKQVAQIMEDNVGDKGVPARWGGEELAIYFPEMELEDAFDHAEILRIDISEETNPAITISCGISSWKKGDYTTHESLFLKADEALYSAKSRAKNCVVIA